MAQNTSFSLSKSLKTLHVSSQVFSYVMRYYQNAFEARAAGRAKIVYHTGIDPIEIDYAMGLIPIFPENFSAACGSIQAAPGLIQASEHLGAPQDLCSYFKTHYGFMKGDLDPQVRQSLSRIRLPDPDLVVSTKKLCRLHPLWMKLVAEHYGVPFFSLDSPIMPPRYEAAGRVTEELVGVHYPWPVGEEALTYCVEQIREYIAFLEYHTGTKLDMDRLKETIARADELGRLFQQILELRRTVPCPVGGEDMNSLVFFPACLSGTQEAVDAFRQAAEEVEGRVASSKGVVPEERFRILFEGIPPWFNMGLLNYLHRFGAVSVEEMYPRTWCGRLDPERPLESLAHKYMLATTAIATYGAVREIAVQRVRLYRADGAVLWNLPTCRVIAATVMPRLQAVFERDAGIPTLLLEGDQVDSRRYNEALITGRIEAFMEVLEQRKYGN